jgi:putative DNA primase/helicase
VAARYVYEDEAGKPLFEVSRWEPKGFSQARIDDRGLRVRSRRCMAGVRSVPFQLPDLIQAVTVGDPIYVVEGERDVESVRANGCAATCNAGGAGKWRESHAAPFKNAIDVRVVADNDKAGRKHARDVVESLAAVGATVTLWRSPIGSDVSDLLAAGHKLGDLEPFELGEVISNRKHVSDLPKTTSPDEPPADLYSDSDAAQKRRTTMIEEPHTDRGHARRIAALFSTQLAWVPEWRTWAQFDGQRWKKNAEEKALELAQSVSDVMLDMRSEAPDSTTFAKAAIKLQGVKDAARALEAARPILLIPAEEFDAKPYLLNCPNGTLDLRTLELRAHNPMDRLTLVTAAAYEPEAQHDMWDRVIKNALPDDLVRGYVQRQFGLTLDGSEQLDQVLLVYGITRTGKGTIQGALHNTLGEYAHTAGLEDLVLRDRAHAGPRPELVQLQGKRMVSIYETSRVLQLDAALLKTIAGSDPVSARDLYARPITFVPQFTLWIASNYRPSLPAADDAVWERLREIPFGVQVPKEQRDRTVRATLNDPKQAGAAILAWAVEGLRQCRETGLATPKQVIQATSSYRAEMDILAGFGEDCLTFGDPSIYQASPRQLRDALDRWRVQAAVEPVPAEDLRDWLRARGCVYGQSRTHGRRRMWSGVGIAHQTEAQ